MRAAPVLLIVAVVALGAAGVVYWRYGEAPGLPEGFASANGRIEVERVDVATKEPGRVAEILVEEGGFVAKGAVVARMDAAELLARLVAAKADVTRAAQAIAGAEAEIGIRQAELTLAEIELERASALLQRRAGPQAEVDRRNATRDVAAANLNGARASVSAATAAWEVAEARVDQLEAMLDDLTLTAPVSGRVEYRLVQPGEVVGAGGRIVTILDLTDVFMVVFMPTSEAGRVAHGSEARIVLDAAPQYVVPATVSFVAAEAQFTPRAVETANEREKLMYRVKLRIDPALLETYRDYVRSGLTGDAYLKVSAAARWPDQLAPKLPEIDVPDAGS
jgi:HlyD family secretion protein